MSSLSKSPLYAFCALLLLACGDNLPSSERLPLGAYCDTYNPECSDELTCLPLLNEISICSTINCEVGELCGDGAGRCYELATTWAYGVPVCVSFCDMNNECPLGGLPGANQRGECICYPFAG